MSGVHLIAAVGLSGQIGLDGKVPWHGDPVYAEQTKRDLAEFARLTAGGIVVMGSITARSLPLSMLRNGGTLNMDRILHVWSRNICGGDPARWLETFTSIRSRQKRPIWICGGQKVYELFIPYVDWHHISVIPYDGPADRFLPPILPTWRSIHNLGYPVHGVKPK